MQVYTLGTLVYWRHLWRHLWHVLTEFFLLCVVQSTMWTSSSSSLLSWTPWTTKVN